MEPIKLPLESDADSCFGAFHGFTLLMLAI